MGKFESLEAGVQPRKLNAKRPYIYPFNLYFGFMKVSTALRLVSGHIRMSA